jgi:hypothetical protein
MSGFCTNCDSVVDCEYIEPDAEKYRCPECDDMTLMGLEQAAICGFWMPSSEEEMDDLLYGDGW